MGTLESMSEQTPRRAKDPRARGPGTSSEPALADRSRALAQEHLQESARDSLQAESLHATLAQERSGESLSFQSRAEGGSKTNSQRRKQHAGLTRIQW